VDFLGLAIPLVRAYNRLVRLVRDLHAETKDHKRERKNPKNRP
jgi:hypothetical protein